MASAATLSALFGVAVVTMVTFYSVGLVNKTHLARQRMATQQIMDRVAEQIASNAEVVRLNDGTLQGYNPLAAWYNSDSPTPPTEEIEWTGDMPGYLPSGSSSANGHLDPILNLRDSQRTDAFGNRIMLCSRAVVANTAVMGRPARPVANTLGSPAAVLVSPGANGRIETSCDQAFDVSDAGGGQGDDLIRRVNVVDLVEGRKATRQALGLHIPVCRVGVNAGKEILRFVEGQFQCVDGGPESAFQQIAQACTDDEAVMNTPNGLRCTDMSFMTNAHNAPFNSGRVEAGLCPPDTTLNSIAQAAVPTDPTHVNFTFQCNDGSGGTVNLASAFDANATFGSGKIILRLRDNSLAAVSLIQNINSNTINCPANGYLFGDRGRYVCLPPVEAATMGNLCNQGLPEFNPAGPSLSCSTEMLNNLLLATASCTSGNLYINGKGLSTECVSAQELFRRELIDSSVASSGCGGGLVLIMNNNGKFICGTPRIG
ncbi:MAG: hypothetical protein AB7U41_03595 [Dongiaceae bacterium]